MSFRVSERTLELLEWPTIVSRLAEELRTPMARLAFEAAGGAGPDLFGAHPGDVRALLAETSEARRLLDQGTSPPLGGGADVAATLSRLRRGGAVTARELLDLQATLTVVGDVARFQRSRAEEAPCLAAHGEALPDLGDLAEEIAFRIDPEGAVRDEASQTLREARREARALSSELTRRIERFLRDPQVTEALSDTFYTLRNDRYVLPVRADARRRVPGIVHDASASGTTLFIEPEAVVDLNNRLKQAELAADREIRRVLRELSSLAAARLPAIEGALATLEQLDRAFARGRLSQQLRGVEPEVGSEGIFRLPGLRHPLIPDDEVVANDVHLGQGFTVLVLSGPNAGGKTVTLKALALCALLVRAGLHVPALPGARVDLVDDLLADIGDAQNLEAHLSTFSAHVGNLARIVEQASSRSLVVLDEIGVGTDPSEGAALAQAVLEALADAGARVVTTTHYNLLKEIAAVDARFENGCVEFDPETLAPTYRLRFGTPGVSSAAALAERMGLRPGVVERARVLLEGEDAQLKGLLTELARTRVELDRERETARRLREEAQAARDEYRARADELRERRRTLLQRQRKALEQDLREARGRVAAVIRDLQRGATARDAAHARERLVAVEADFAASVPDETRPGDTTAIDWELARPGDRVRVEGGGAGRLVTLPDRRNRVTVQIGSSRMVVPAERLRSEEEVGSVPASERRPPSVRFERAVETDPTTKECDLRGLRVDEALEQVDGALDRALATGCGRVRLIHGHGTGVLREAVRAHLANLPQVREYAPGDESEGGNGVTVVVLD